MSGVSNGKVYETAYLSRDVAHSLPFATFLNALNPGRGVYIFGVLVGGPTLYCASYECMPVFKKRTYICTHTGWSNANTPKTAAGGLSEAFQNSSSDRLTHSRGKSTRVFFFRRCGKGDHITRNLTQFTHSCTSRESAHFPMHAANS